MWKQSMSTCWLSCRPAEATQSSSIPWLGIETPSLFRWSCPRNRWPGYGLCLLDGSLAIVHLENSTSPSVTWLSLILPAPLWLSSSSPANSDTFPFQEFASQPMTVPTWSSWVGSESSCCDSTPQRPWDYVQTIESFSAGECCLARWGRRIPSDLPTVWFWSYQKVRGNSPWQFPFYFGELSKKILINMK